MSSTTGRVYTPEQIARAKRTLYQAEMWRKNNHQAWACVVSHALELAAKEQPIGTQALIESVRKKAFVDRFGNDTKTNNSFASIFARWLIAEYPALGQHIELRHSVYDMLIPGGVMLP